MFSTAGGKMEEALAALVAELSAAVAVLAVALVDRLTQTFSVLWERPPSSEAQRGAAVTTLTGLAQRLEVVCGRVGAEPPDLSPLLAPHPVSQPPLLQSMQAALQAETEEQEMDGMQSGSAEGATSGSGGGAASANSGEGKETAGARGQRAHETWWRRWQRTNSYASAAAESDQEDGESEEESEEYDEDREWLAAQALAAQCTSEEDEDSDDQEGQESAENEGDGEAMDEDKAPAPAAELEPGQERGVPLAGQLTSAGVEDTAHTAEQEQQARVATSGGCIPTASQQLQEQPEELAGDKENGPAGSRPLASRRRSRRLSAANKMASTGGCVALAQWAKA